MLFALRNTPGPSNLSTFRLYHALVIELLVSPKIYFALRPIGFAFLFLRVFSLSLCFISFLFNSRRAPSFVSVPIGFQTILRLLGESPRGIPGFLANGRHSRRAHTTRKVLDYGEVASSHVTFDELTDRVIATLSSRPRAPYFVVGVRSCSRGISNAYLFTRACLSKSTRTISARMYLPSF